MWAGDDHHPRFCLAEHRCAIEHILGFQTEIEFLHNRLGEQLNQCWRVRERRDGNASDKQRREPAHGFQITMHVGCHRGPLNLHHDFLTGNQRGGVHLRNGCRSNRGVIDEGKNLVNWLTEVFDDGLLHHIPRLGGHGIAEEAKLVYQFGRKNTLARRNDLAHLDIGGPKNFEGLAQPTGNSSPALGSALRLFLDAPHEECSTEYASGANHSAPRGQLSWCGEHWHLRCGAGPHPIKTNPPRELSWINNPGPVIGERPNG